SSRTSLRQGESLVAGAGQFLSKNAMSSVCTWAGRLPCTSARELGAVRLMAGWEGAIVADDFLVRGPRLGPSQRRDCAPGPGEEPLDVSKENSLRSPAHHLPAGVMPSVSWSPLRELLRVRLPLSTSTVRLPKRVEIELRPDEEMREPKLLEAATQDWFTFVC